MNDTNNISTVQAFDFAPGMSLRSVTKDGHHYFIGKDVCDALGYVNSRDALASLDDDERNTVAISDGKQGNPNRVVISESGLYSLIVRSNKTEAKAFKRWITGTVLPSLRKDGIYIAGQEKPITDSLTLPELMAQIAEIQAKVDAINTAKVVSWSRHQEEKDARRDAFAFFRKGRVVVRP